MKDLRAFDAGAAWAGIAPVARVVWGLAGVAVVTSLGAAAVVAALVAGAGGTAVAAGVVATVVLGAGWWWLAGRQQQAWGFAERGADLLLRRGLLVQRLTIVPYGRMQFVDLQQGPLARRLGLASVQLHTAAAATDARIPMLPEDDARRLADRLAALGEARAAGL